MKNWGRGEFWGIGCEYDPDWLLTPHQIKIRDDLIELCRVKIRPHAAKCDGEYIFPRESLNAMAELKLLSLIVPKELGGLGENHVCATMVVETLARYGCPSTAMVYTMHLSSVAVMLLRHHDNPKVKDVLRRLDKDKLVGTLCYSDPATGGHCWFQLSSKVQQIDKDRVKLLKYGSWATSAGFADFYCVRTISPGHKEGNYSDLSCFLIFKEEIRANTEDWSALGMHGNMSGPLVIEGTFSMDRMIGPPGDGTVSKDEVSPYFLMLSSGVWNGIALGAMDIARKHVTRKAHADVGMRVCDYPTIQDYFGEAMSDVNASRAMAFMVANLFDKVTNNNDWSIYKDPKTLARTNYMQWGNQAKFHSAKLVATVCDKMLHATGGSGYKSDLGLERLLRDGKAAWVMGPSNEVARQIIGKCVLLGEDAVDYWEQRANKRLIHHEVNKMTVAEKKKLAESLRNEIEIEENGKNHKHPYQETDFENPFNTKPPAVSDKVIKTSDGVSHAPALKPDKWVQLKLESMSDVNNKMGSFVFALPNKTDHTGCYAGQYVMVRVKSDGREHTRYFSPVSLPNAFGKIELVLKFENQGFLSQHFKALKPGDSVEFQGPCGGFEYEPGLLQELTLLASGGGITPCLQLVRQVLSNPQDKTNITLLYFSETYNDILYRKELEKYQASDKRLKLVYTLGEAPERWEGEEGFIDTQMIDKYVLKPNGIKNKIVMCGGAVMVFSCLHSLHSLGFPSQCIFVYGQFGAQQVKAVFGKKVPLSSHHCCG